MSRPKGKRGQDQNVGSIEQFTSVSGRPPPRWMEKKRRFLTSCLETGGENSFFKELFVNMFQSFATLTVGPCSQTGAFASRSGLRSTLGLASRQSCGSGRHRSSVRDPRAGARGPLKNIIMSQGYAHSWALLADGGFCLQKWASLNVGPCLSTILRKWQT